MAAYRVVYEYVVRNSSGYGVRRVLCSERLSGYGVGRVLCSEGLSGYGVGRVLCSEGLSGYGVGRVDTTHTTTTRYAATSPC